VLEDEELYRKGFCDLINKSKVLQSTISIEYFVDSEQVLQGIKNAPPDIIICDIDLGHSSLNGFDFVKHIRQQGYFFPICMHSNRSLPDDYEHALKAGAQALIPKPMTSDHLIKFIVNVIQSIPDQTNSTMTLNSTIPSSSTVSKIGRSKLPQLSLEENKTVRIFDGLCVHNIVVIEDDELTRLGWERLLPGRVKTFTCPESFWLHCKNDSSFFDAISVIIIDNSFDGFSAITGFDFAKDLKVRGLHKPLFLSSGGIFNDEEICRFFTDQLPKFPKAAIKKLKKWLDNNPLVVGFSQES
jgi:DNA-binding NarL/FixJ family response regulator